MMLFSGFKDVKFVDATIAGEIIMWFFVAIAILAFVIFLFNLMFIRPASSIKKNTDSVIVVQQQEFENQRSEVETQIALILRVEEDEAKLRNHVHREGKEK